MIKQFHTESQRSMTSSVDRSNLNRNSGFRHIRDILLESTAHFEMPQKERERMDRVNALRSITTERALIQENPDNLWRVYSLCKHIYELAEIDRVDFNGASFLEKLNFIRQLVPFADPDALREGVTEYHESRIRENWQMDFLKEDNAHDSAGTGGLA